jgi:hypothetical protein
LKPDPRPDDGRGRRSFVRRLVETFGQHPEDVAALFAVVLGGAVILTYGVDLGWLESILLMLAFALGLFAVASAIFRR